MDRSPTSSSTRSRTNLLSSESSLVEDTTEASVEEASASQADARNLPHRPPALRTRDTNESLLSRIFPESPEDTQLKLEARRIEHVLPNLMKVERELVALNNKLEALLRLLRVATMDGAQTALSTAAGKVESAIAALDSVAANPLPNVRPSDAEAARRLKLAHVNQSWTAYSKLYQATGNRSKDIDDQYVALNTKYRAACPQQGTMFSNTGGSQGSDDDDDSSS